MIYRQRNDLNIMELGEYEENIFFDRLEKVILSRPSNIIYCERDKKLQGIISMGDIARASEAGKDFVVANTQFTSLKKGEYMKARNIFRDRQSINALPVLDNDGVLTGGWSRWNDMLWNEEVFEGGANWEYCKGVRAALVVSHDASGSEYDMVRLYGKRLAVSGIDVKEICHDEILHYIDRVDFVLFASEDERRAFETLYGYMHNMSLDSVKLVTCKEYTRSWVCGLVAGYLHDICQQGVHVLNLYFGCQNKYYKKLIENVCKKYDKIGKKISNELIPEFYKDFFGDLYTEKYLNSIRNIKYGIETKTGSMALKEFQSNVCHIVNGERFTKGVPEKYTKTVYFVGPCFIYGHYAEDANTVESLLQKRFNKEGYEVKVVNCGSPAYSGNNVGELARIQAIDFRKGDMIVEHFDNIIFRNVNNLDLSSALKEVSADWVINEPRHCNHKVNALYADAIYDALKPVLNEHVPGQGELIEKDKDFVKSLYIDRYFCDFNPCQYEKIGAIVMNCNPFTYGHRHLIERALDMVDFLIIFVVEEDRSVFNFDERYAMARRGTADLKNVKVVPSGSFILSQTTFPEYFIKAADEDLAENVENDITIFAEKIAPHLNIKYRFVGEEPDDAVTNEYNTAMKHVLPEHGIELVEIPRKKQDGRYISASSVRRCLEDNDMAGFRELVPDSTVRVLFEGVSVLESD